MFIKSKKVYNFLKWCAQILFPAIGTLYFALADLWNLPYATEVVGTITAIDAFLGAVIQVSSTNYKKEVESIENE